MLPPSLYVLEPAKQVELSDRQLLQAQALYEGYQTKLNPYDRVLVQSLLAYSGDLRYGFEDKYLLTRVRQARLYCKRVYETLRMIQMAVEKAIDMRAHSVQIRVPVWPRHANPHVVFDVREFEDQLGKRKAGRRLPSDTSCGDDNVRTPEVHHFIGTNMYQSRRVST
ncbi:hypothetical protein EDB87DRAFT_1579732 [Lactarius vividus]|nr:hypothetical protein EDB87DRAFT_1579732 [Lactarius vividus]